MKKLVCVLLICSIVLASCAGQEANPVAVYRPGDENKSCNVLKAEIANIDKQIKIKKAKKSSKDWSNAAWFIGGFLLIVPWFFMDLKNAEQTEIDALQQRKDALHVIAADKNCNF